MERPQADLSYVVEKIPMGPAFPTGQHATSTQAKPS